MSEPFQFSHTKIAEHTEKVGVDIRPIIEPKLDEFKLYNVGKDLRQHYPNLFESLVQSPTGFRITKKFIFPAKGELELTTLTIMQRGPVFTFPRTVGVFGEDVELGNVEDIAIECLDIFLKAFPEKKVIRVGLVDEYVFDTGADDSFLLVSDRFTKLSMPADGEIRLRINRPTDDYNRIIDIEAARKLEPIPEIPGTLQHKGYGVKVKVDFNNREMGGELDKSRILSILHEGKKYNHKEIYQFLNGSPGE